MNKRKLLTVSLMCLTLLGCGESAEEVAAKETVKNNDSSIIASCSYESVSLVSISTVSNSDTAAICEKMARRIGSNPSIRALRSLSTAISAMSMKSKVDDIADMAYQYMRIVESRGQLNNDTAMINTFNIVFKINNGMEGRVSPKDLNILLSNLGDDAKKLSDEGVMYLAASLSVKKQDAGY